MADRVIIKQLLDAVPHQRPFRFIDEINEVDSGHIVGSYTFRPDEFFYCGHFPGNPITPGVILVETMAQVAVVAFGLYLLMVEREMAPEQLRKITTLFSFMESVEFIEPVLPGEKVIVRGEKMYFRRSNLKVQATMQKGDGRVVCQGILAGTGIKF